MELKNRWIVNDYDWMYKEDEYRREIMNKELSILTVNVCGIKSKSVKAVFKGECCKHDILCFYRNFNG